MKRVYVLAISAMIWALLVAEIAYAQVTTATIYGRILDPSGDVVPRATITVTNELTGYTTSTTSNERGEFTLTFLPIGRYALSVEAPGFKKRQQTGLELATGQKVDLALNLELGETSETITVKAEAPLIENASTSQSYRLSSLQYTELPQSRRDFTALLALSTGFRFTRDGMMQFNGLASGGNSITVDGVDGSGITETPSAAMFQNFNTIKVISMEAIQEVNISRGVMSAEVGRTYSANVNLVTKGGTNEFHGSVFEAVQNDVFNAKSAMQRPGEPKAPVRLNQFGGSVGGPIKRNRAFFFFAYEGLRESRTSIRQGAVPSEDLRQRAVSAVADYKKLLDFFPLPNRGLLDANSGLYLGPNINRADDNHLVARGDWYLTTHNQLMARYIRSRPDSSGQRFPTLTFRDFHGVFDSVTVTYFHTAPRWTTETRFNFKRDRTNRVETLWEQGRIAAIEVQGVFSTQGEGLFIRGHNYSIENVLAKFSGRHALKFGLYYGARVPGRFDEEVPILRYRNVADFLANRPNRVRVTFGQPDYRGRIWELHGFVQDDFRIKPNLMLNLGLRYEYYSVYKERNGLIFNPDGLAAAVSKPTRFRPPDSPYEPDRNNFLPRIGLVWSPDQASKTVIRAGFGVTQAQIDLRNLSTLHMISPEVPFRLDITGSDIARLGLKYPVSNESMLSIVKTMDVPRGFSMYDPTNRNPYALHWTFDIQRQLTPTLALQTGYVGNKGLKIIASHIFNIGDRVTGVRPFPGALEIPYKTGSDFSYYHAWQTSLRKRTSSGLTFTANYTWSKAMAIHGGDFWGGLDWRVQDDQNWRADKGPAPFDVTHRFTADYVYQLPSPAWASTGALRQLLGGWILSGVVTAETGEALNVVQRSNRDFSRPDFVGGDPYAKGDRFQWLNPAAFARVPVSSASGQPIRPGTLGKNALRAPGRWDVSLALGKIFRLGERYQVQLRGEALNAFNHVNLGTPEADITRSAFGRILNVGAGRTIQLRARFSF